MNIPSYFQKPLLAQSLKKSSQQKKSFQQNKPNTINLNKKGYQQDQQSYIIKCNDTFQVKDLKNKMKVIMQKLLQSRKEKEQLYKENQNMEKEIITVRNSLRHMIPGFSNTSGNFPMNNQLIANLQQFYKYQCLDRFFQNLCPEELSMKGVIYFFHFSFTQIMKIIDQYFEGTFQSLKNTGCMDSLQGPIMNVLRKSFQSTFAKILQKMLSTSNLQQIVSTLIQKLSLQPTSQLQTQLLSFQKSLLQLCLQCKISDPPLIIQIQSIGKKIKYNSTYNDPLDGFIRNKDQCWVVLPEIRKLQTNQVVVKSLVLKIDYFQTQDNQQDDQQ